MLDRFENHGSGTCFGKDQFLVVVLFFGPALPESVWDEVGCSPSSSSAEWIYAFVKMPRMHTERGIAKQPTQRQFPAMEQWLSDFLLFLVKVMATIVSIVGRGNLDGASSLGVFMSKSRYIVWKDKSASPKLGNLLARKDPIIPRFLSWRANEYVG